MLLLIALGTGKKSREGKMLHRKADAKCLGGGEKEQGNISRQIARLSAAAAAVAVHSVLPFPLSFSTQYYTAFFPSFPPEESGQRIRRPPPPPPALLSFAFVCFR